jgi:hypothetical protein
MLVHKKVTKEHDTPYRSHFACHFSGLANWGSPLRASCVARLDGRQAELAKNWLRQPLAGTSH